MDRLTEMEAFVSVVDQGGFTGAARKLELSKSAVSKHVSSLEARLGVRLLNRTTRRVNPTEFGLLYYERAQLVLAAALDADAMVGVLNSEPEGILRVAVTTDYGEAVVTPKVPEFLKANPAVSLELTLTDAPVELHSEGFDLALSPGTALLTNNNTRVIDTIKQELVAAPSYMANRTPPARIEDLVSHALLHGNMSEGERTWRLTAPSGETRIVRGSPCVSVNSAKSLAELARAGLGITLLPSYMIDADLASGALVRVMPSLPEQTLDIVATLPDTKLTKPKTAAFLKALTSVEKGAKRSESEDCLPA